jgi:hypothetical protein
VIDGRGAEARERLGGALGRVGEHRMHGPEELEAEAREPRGTVGQRGFRDGASVTGQHDGTAHLAGGQSGRLRERFDEQPFERPLAELADDEATEEVLLGWRRAGEKRAELAAALRGGSGSAPARDALERGVDLGERQRRRGGGIARVRRRGRRPAEADPALPGLAGEESHADPDLVRRERARHDARCAIFADRERVSATRADVATRSWRRDGMRTATLGRKRGDVHAGYGKK